MAIMKNLNALDEFSCLADRCPDHCCQGWDIDIDEKTYALWNAIEDGSLKEKLLTNIVVNNDKKLIKQPPGGGCYHMDSNKLCTIHAQLGENYLAHTCKTYPRIKFKNYQVLTHTAKLSCPEITRLVLLNNNDELFTVRDMTDEEFAQSDNTDSYVPTNILNELQAIIVDYYDKSILVKDLSLGVWFYDIADVLSYLVMLLKEKRFSLELLQKKSGKSKKILQNRFDSIKKEFKSNKTSADVDTENEFWLKVYRLYETHAINEFDEIVTKNEVEKLLLNNNRVSFGELVEKSLKKLNTKIRLDEKLKNYAQVKFYNHGFPWYPYKENYMATFLQCVLPISMVAMWVTLFDIKNVEVDEEKLIKIIYKIEREFGHNTHIFAHFKEGGFWADLDHYKPALLRLGAN